MSDALAHLPPSVRAQAEAANALHKQAYPDPAETPSPAGEAPPEAPKPEPVAETFADGGPVQPPVTQQVTQPAPTEANWEHRYLAMKGRYDQAQRQVDNLTRDVLSMRQQIAELQVRSQVERPVTRETPKELQPQSLVTQKELEDWSPELIDVVGRKAKEVLLPEIHARDQEIERLKKQLQGVGEYVQVSARQKMLNDMDSRMPAWRQLNDRKEFIDWLSLPDRYSGVIKHDMLKAAFDRNDTDRVLAFFNGFLAEEAAVAPAPTPAPPSAQPTVNLADLAAPGRAATTAAPAPVDKPVWTTAQISEFYRDVNRGTFRGRDTERLAIEKSIFEAQRDGRVR